MSWTTFGLIVSVLANSVTAISLVFLVLQYRHGLRARAKDASQGVWDLLADERVYKARTYLECTPPPADFGSAMKENSEWMRAARRCYLAYQKAAVLVLRHKWISPELYAKQWGHSTLVVWAALKPWIDWYSETRSYPAYGDSLRRLVETIDGYNDQTLGFSKEAAGVLGRESLPNEERLQLTISSVVPTPEP